MIVGNAQPIITFTFYVWHYCNIS